MYLPTVSVLGGPEVGKTVKGTSRELRNSRASVQGSGSCRSVREHHELPGHLGAGGEMGSGRMGCWGCGVDSCRAGANPGYLH